jgi:hypothetical protein
VWSSLTTLDYGGRLLRPCLTVSSISDPKKVWLLFIFLV